MSNLERYFKGIDKQCIYELFKGVYLERSTNYIILNIIAGGIHVAKDIYPCKVIDYEEFCTTVQCEIKGLYERIGKAVSLNFYLNKR